MRHWKYCTDWEPWATACMEESRCMPGRFNLLTGCQLVMLGVLSISSQGSRLIERIRSWFAAAKAATDRLSPLCHQG